MDFLKCFSCNLEIVDCLEVYDNDIRHSLCPRRNAPTLESEMRLLRTWKRGVQTRPRVPSTVVDDWIQHVEAIEREVRQVLSTLQHPSQDQRGRSCCCCCCFNWDLSSQVDSLLGRVQQLKVQHDRFDPDIFRRPQLPIPAAVSPIVGGERELKEVWQHLRDDDGTIIGIYGQGGIGKTTLLKEIYNDPVRLRDCNLYPVIWVDVSRTPDHAKIVEQMAKATGQHPSSSTDTVTSINSFLSVKRETMDPNIIGIQPSSSSTDTVTSIISFLSDKRFLVILDDVWGRVDPNSIGIPIPNNHNRGKILFTTRSEGVCASMDAGRRVQVGFLNEVDSWTLFSQKIGTGVAIETEAIQPLARKVVSKCGGSPLALITVGRALSNRKLPGEWEAAIWSMDNAPQEIQGMEQVMSLLKFSYDNLRNDQLRSCLLHCSLLTDLRKFSYDILVLDLIESWLGEGLLSDPNDPLPGRGIQVDRNNGLVFINDLRSAGLLETSILGERYVRLHDTVRDMAIWITKNPPTKYHRVYNDPHQQLTLEEWTDASKVCMELSNFNGTFPDDTATPGCPFKRKKKMVPRCPHLISLIMSKIPKLTNIPRKFFSYMPRLRVLDLGDTNLTHIPSSISLLVELRYLDVSGTQIQEVPKCLGKLKKLRQLAMDRTKKLRRIPRQAILGLPMLKSLQLLGSSYAWVENNQQLRVSDLEMLIRLEEISIDINSHDNLTLFLSSPLCEFARIGLTLSGGFVTVDILSSVIMTMPNLWILRIHGCTQLEEFTFPDNHLSRLEDLILEGLTISRFIWQTPTRVSHMQNIRRVAIERCPNLRDVSWVRLLPRVDILTFQDYNGLECILGEEVEAEDRDRIQQLSGEGGFSNNSAFQEVDESRCTFPKLSQLRLMHLPNLRSISPYILLVPFLHNVHVIGCPSLRRLPLGPQSAKKMKKFWGEQDWWDGLLWDLGDKAKITFNSCFIPLSGDNL